MKKQWVKRLAAVSLTVVVGTGLGTTLWAQGEEKDVNLGGGGDEVQKTTSNEDKEDRSEITEETFPAETEMKQQLKKGIGISEKSTAKKRAAKKENVVNAFAENGQTKLDVSKGDIRITANGAVGGGLAENETELNEKGYWITGTTTLYNIVVERGVTAKITLDHVDITCATSDCINVSHADVIITLIGDNHLLCTQVEASNALTKDGMDGSLTLRCESSGQKNHRCDDSCGSLIAKGEGVHVGAIGSSIKNRKTSGESGFSDFTIQGGNIEALGGLHCPAIGSACWTEAYTGAYTKDIYITGGNVKAIGTEFGSGIGSGYGNKVEGIYISGGTVEAQGGANAPGIGASTGDGSVSKTTENVCITGGDTVVTAIGDSATGMPGIGSGSGKQYVSNVTAEPDDKYQGYIQDGVSLTDYTFMDGTPFQEKTDIRVEKFYTQVYFGPFRDANGINKGTKEQIGANHVISKTGGKGFTEEQIFILAKVTGKQSDGQNFSVDSLSLSDQEQLKKINEAKAAGKTGDFPLTFTTPNGTEVSVVISLRDDGTDAEKFDPNNPTVTVGANDFQKETGGSAFTEEQVKEYGQLKAKDENGNNIELDDFTVDKEQLDKINEAKTSGKAGEFELTYEAPDGTKVTITVGLTGEYDDLTENTENGEMIKGKNVISRTGGDAFTIDQIKELTQVKAADKDGNEIPKEQLELDDENQLKLINEAKKAGKTGDFPLTFQTPGKTKVTVTVFLRDSGADAGDYGPDSGFSFIGANHAVSKTGGNAFSTDDIRKLCKAAGKDKNGDNTPVIPDQKQLDVINAAKTSGKTGSFILSFSLKDGNKTEVTVTLTGTHQVSFDTKGGHNTPEIQHIDGGSCATKPKDSEKAGYIFEGWYYIEDSGTERKWDFNTPIHQDIVLTAKWKTAPKQNTETTETEQKNGKKANTVSKKVPDKNNNKWKYKEVSHSKNNSGRVANTGDNREGVWILGSIAGITGAGIWFWKRKKCNR
nr:InlB B-repeat-containing protein [uncultured Anaerostipes sp.]